MRKPFLSIAAVLAFSVVAVSAAFADSVSATLDFGNNSTTPSTHFNYFAPGNAPGGYSQNMNATFTYKDSFNMDTAIFDGTYLTITDTSYGGASAFLMTFTDPDFTGFTLVSNTFSGNAYGAFDYTFSNGTLTFNSPGTSLPGTQTAVFKYTDSADAPVIAATPEPSSLLLMGTGLVSLAGFVRHRRKSDLAFSNDILAAC